jgi:glycosyltransferase involved in cell wall biosynthesis
MILSIIVPVYNECDTILTVLQRVQQLPVDKEIIVIDNCSTDGTRELLQELDDDNLRVILQPRNLKKGNSVKKGIEAAQGTYTVIQDADLEYDPQDLQDGPDPTAAEPEAALRRL